MPVIKRAGSAKKKNTGVPAKPPTKPPAPPADAKRSAKPVVTSANEALLVAATELIQALTNLVNVTTEALQEDRS